MPETDDSASPADGGDLGLVLIGGGARAAYQVGVLRCLGRHLPGLRPRIITGFSAGAINAVYLASHGGTMGQATAELGELWNELELEKVFKVGPLPLLGNAVRWLLRLASGGSPLPIKARSLLDSSPLRLHLQRVLGTVDGMCHGIGANLESGRLRAVALSTLKYATGQTVTWIEGRDVSGWRRPDRVGVRTQLSIDHIMASTAMPLIFPAIRLGNAWYGDGGLRLSTPLAPAIRLGASRILAISTRFRRTQKQADTPMISGYPPVAQVVGNMLNAMFLDAIDEDQQELERINRLLSRLPQDDWEGLRQIGLEVLRPSQDLGRLAQEYEEELPGTLRFLTRSLGTRETASPDILSLVMFHPGYLQRLIEIGEADTERRIERILPLLSGADQRPGRLGKGG